MIRSRARRVVSLLLTSACAALAAAPAAAQVARVLIALPPQSDALVAEALIRIRGELSAVGLRVELKSPGSQPATEPEFGSADYGVLVLERNGELIEIHAFAPGLDSPVIQTADTRQPGINAEVVAVRAVEALRAAMVQYARSKLERHEAVPAPVTGFTKVLAPARVQREPARPPAKSHAAEPDAAPRKPSADRLDWTLWLGGNVVIDFPTAADSWGGQAAMFVAYDWFRAGVSIDRTWVAARIDDAAGSSWMRRTAVAGRLRAVFSPDTRFELFLGLGAGAAHYSFASVAAAGYASNDDDHASPLLLTETGCGFWFIRYAGAYVEVRADLATDAPRLRFAGREVALLERPALSASLGLMVGRF